MIEFPLNFDKCPACGDGRRLATEMIKEEIKKGKAGADARAYINKTQTIVVDQRRTWLSAPVLVSYYDICPNCGTYYCFRVESGVAMPQSKIPGRNQ